MGIARAGKSEVYSGFADEPPRRRDRSVTSIESGDELAESRPGRSGAGEAHPTSVPGGRLRKISAVEQKACRIDFVFQKHKAFSRQLDEAAVGVAHVGGAAPREVSRSVDGDACAGHRGSVLFEPRDGEGDMVLGGRVAGRGLDRDVDPEHEVTEREDCVPIDCSVAAIPSTRS